MDPIIITGTVNDISIEDGGAAKIADLDDMLVNGEEHSPFFVRLQSWDDLAFNHETLDAMHGKKVRITVEVLE